MLQLKNVNDESLTTPIQPNLSHSHLRMSETLNVAEVKRERVCVCVIEKHKNRERESRIKDRNERNGREMKAMFEEFR